MVPISFCIRLVHTTNKNLDPALGQKTSLGETCFQFGIVFGLLRYDVPGDKRKQLLRYRRSCDT